MKKVEICEHCGAKTVEYKHGLSKSLMRAFIKFVIAVDCQPWGIADFSALDLTYSQGSNFQKLRYWKLIEKVGDPEGKGGQWRLTSRGAAFAKGGIWLPIFAWTYRGDVTDHEGDLKTIDQITGGWKYRPEYAREARGA